MADILVTLRGPQADPQRLNALAAPLGGYTRLDAVAPADQPAAVAAARVVVSFKPHKEMTPEALAALHAGQLLQIISAGLDDLPFDTIPTTVTVAGNSGAFATPMSEHAVGMVLCLAKRLCEEDTAMRQGQFNQMRSNLLLSGKKAAVLGLGGAGKAVARLLQALGMQVFALNTSGKTNEPVAFIGTIDQLDTILRDAQVVVLTLPYTHLTHSLIGERQLALLRPNAILVNVARGEIIDQKALYEHMLAHQEFKAGLESWWVEPLRHGRFELEYPLLELPNLLASPHNSFAVAEWPELSLEAAFANIGRYLRGEPLTGLRRPELHHV